MTSTATTTTWKPIDEDELRQYYNRLFPFDAYYDWLSYGGFDKKEFQNREFSFTLQGDVYVRYKSFDDKAELKKAIQDICPHKIDIGAVFTARPRDHKRVKASEFYPVSKEVVFDIDMTDYDEIRTCCSGADICGRCWPFMTASIKVLDRALREDFGFEHLLWVYSGRRGIHCWVCDKKARHLSQEARGAVAEYLQLVTGSDQMACKVTVAPSYPAAARAYEVLKDYFLSTIVSADGQNLFEHQAERDVFLDAIEDEGIKEHLIAKWGTQDMTPTEKWTSLEEKMTKEGKKTRLKQLMLQYTYPRLDIAVSKGLNHLLKSPFAVHPKTGCVCIPINPHEAELFNPKVSPTVALLLREIDDGVSEGSLASHVQYFADFVKNLLKAERREYAQADSGDMDDSLDW